MSKAEYEASYSSARTDPGRVSREIAARQIASGLLRGYLAYTVDASQMPQPSDIHFSSPEQWSYTDTWSVFLRHQTHWLHYPFASISSYGGSSYTGRSGPIQTIHAVFSFHF